MRDLSEKQENDIDDLSEKMTLTTGRTGSQSAITAALSFGLVSRALAGASRAMANWGVAAGGFGPAYIPGKSRKSDKQKRRIRTAKLSRRKSRK